VFSEYRKSPDGWHERQAVNSLMMLCSDPLSVYRQPIVLTCRPRAASAVSKKVASSAGVCEAGDL
jgi:hypothetical protein